MRSKTLTTTQPTDGEHVDRALLQFPPLDPAVLLVVRFLQAQLDALAARVETLETP